MGVVKKAGMVPQTVNDDPTASLIAWGVPVSADRPSKIRLESETRDSLHNEIKAFPRLSLEAVERRLSVKLDILIEKVDQLQADITPHSIGLIAIQDGDERRNRSSSEASQMPDARKRTSTESSESRYESRCEKERLRNSCESTETDGRPRKSVEYKRTSSEKELELFLPMVPPTRTEKIFGTIAEKGVAARTVVDGNKRARACTQ
jgi:hypothetical protein